MAFRKKGLASYGEVSVQAGTAYADSVQLIQMLFDGLIDSLAAAEGHGEGAAGLALCSSSSS